MNVMHEERHGVCLVVVSGAVDSRCANALREELNAIPRTALRRIVVDLRNLDSLTQPILRVLLWLAERTPPRCLALCVDLKARKAFEAADLGERFLLAGSQEEAIERVAGAPTLSPLTGTMCRVLGVASITDVVEELVVRQQVARLAAFLVRHLAVPSAGTRPRRRGPDRGVGPVTGSFDRPPLEPGN